MNASEILVKLTQQGVQFWVENNKLNIRSPKGIITPEMQAKIATYKADILALLQEMNVTPKFTTQHLSQGVSLQTIGWLISGASGESTIGYKTPMIDAKLMAKNLNITFRPLPTKYDNKTIIKFRQDLAMVLKDYGVKIIPWQEALTEFSYDFKIPILNRNHSFKIKGIQAEIDAVIDVERHNSLLRKLGILISETLYTLSYSWLSKKRKLNIIQIAKLSSFAEDHAAKYVEDPTNTQVIILSDIDHKFINPHTSYREKIAIGIHKLIKTFSEIVIGISNEKFSILNMNLSDSIFTQQEIDEFVLKSLIPKIFVPITPLLLSQFTVGEYNPYLSKYATQLVKLGRDINSTGLLPPGFKLAEVLKRKSHRDIVNLLVNGRTGVSYGFVAYAEPPYYVGKSEITADEWEDLFPVPGLSSNELRQNLQGRRYLKILINREYVFKQIPDIWLVSSRSGANKTDLNLECDIVRIGLQDKLYLQLPENVHSTQLDIKPSYDIYVMLAISLAAALYTPELIREGAAIVHFHGYPAFEWFAENEYCVGVNNPSVPCGTYESGVLNFLGIAKLANQLMSQNNINNINLVSLIEPDHGTNLISGDIDYLVNRLKTGCASGQIELGGRHFASLKANISDQLGCGV